MNGLSCRFAGAGLLAVLAILCSCDGSREFEPIRNVVFVSVDTLGAKHVGAYGYAEPTTPALDALAEEGVLFERCFTQQTWTLTSHITMMTGLAPQAHGTSSSRVAADDVPTLAESLKLQGFSTAAFVGIGGFMAPRFGLGRGFDAYVIGDMDARKDNLQRRAWLERQAARQRADPSHRFFLFAHYFDPHSDAEKPVPYWAPQPFGLRFVPPGLSWKHSGDFWALGGLIRTRTFDAEDRAVLTGLYDGGVRYADEVGVGGLLEALDDLDLADDTAVIVTADHGEELLEHGSYSHTQPYTESSHVPLLVRGPGLARGLRVPDVVSLVDLAPTVRALVGLGSERRVQGRSLLPQLRGETPKTDTARPAFVDGILGLPDTFAHTASSIVVEDAGNVWSYVNTVYPVEAAAGYDFETRGVGELYQLDSDPGQSRDVREAQPEIAERLKEQLLAWYRENETRARAWRIVGPSAPMLSREELEQLEALGYAQ